MNPPLPVFIAFALIGIVGCAVTIFAATRRRWIHRAELEARIELHNRDYAAGDYERNGWRDQCYELKAQLVRSMQELYRCKDQIVALASELVKAKDDLLAERAKGVQNTGTAPPDNSAVVAPDKVAGES